MRLASLACEKAEEVGATEAEAYVQNTRTIRITFTEEIHDVKTAESTGLGLRVALGKRVAMYSTSILDENEIVAVAKRVVKIAKVAPEDPRWMHFNRRFGKSMAKGYFDKATATIEYDKIMERVKSATSILIERDERVRPTEGLLSLSTSKVSVINSYGQTLEDQETFASAEMRVSAKEAGLESTWSEHHQARSWGEIALDSMATNAVDRAVGFLAAKSIPTREMPVILRNKIAAGVWGWMLFSPINADVVQKGGSPLEGRRGEQIASDDITIIDDGTLMGGIRTRSFDDEGYPTQRTPIVEDGVLKHFLYDNYTALKDGVDSTGNAMRLAYSLRARVASSPRPRPTNLTLKEGSADMDETIQDTKLGLYVEQVIGEYLSNPVTGNLNVTVTHGHVVEDGELKGPVKGVILAGSFPDLLKDGFEVIADDTEKYTTLSGSGFYSPTIKLRQLTVVGK
ncbi:MAG: TldD/PmbA family protein [Candidatus Bathyarchaeota archaeon]|nr:TldD/PmbA family protein [Candidatus Bathyarchaeota archaeon]